LVKPFPVGSRLRALLQRYGHFILRRRKALCAWRVDQGQQPRCANSCRLHQSQSARTEVVVDAASWWSKYAPMYGGRRQHVPDEISSPRLAKLQTKRCKRHDRPCSKATSRHGTQRTDYGAHSDHPTTTCIEQLHFHVRSADICAYDRTILNCCRQETRQALQSRQGGASSCQLLPQHRICSHYPCASSGSNNAVTTRLRGVASI